MGDSTGIVMLRGRRCTQSKDSPAQVEVRSLGIEKQSAATKPDFAETSGEAGPFWSTSSAAQIT